MTTLLRDVRSPAWTPDAPLVHGSQGGLMASQLLRTRPQRVVAPVILSGFVLGASQPADDRLAESRPPVFWGRGDQDRVIAGPAITRTEAWLPAHTDLTRRV